MNLSNIILNHHLTTDENLRNKLWPLKLDNGDFRYVLSDSNIYKTLQVVLAEGVRGRLFGWAGIYYRTEDLITIGIFVKPRYRHHGIGSALKQKAIEIFQSQNKICYWQDIKNGHGDQSYTWYKVEPNGNKSIYY